MAWNDHYFVRCAYQTLLGRQPDAEGLGYYTGRLRSGYSKMRILAQICRSKEVKLYAANLPGLDRALHQHHREQYPLIGGFFRWLSGNESNRPIDRKLRALQNQLFLQDDESSRRFKHMETTLASQYLFIAQQARSIVMDLGGTPSIDIDNAMSGLVEQSLPDGLKQLSPHGRDIYFQFKVAAAKYAVEQHDAHRN